jgi:hypothetical protein
MRNEDAFWAERQYPDHVHHDDDGFPYDNADHDDFFIDDVDHCSRKPGPAVHHFSAAAECSR